MRGGAVSDVGCVSRLLRVLYRLFNIVQSNESVINMHYLPHFTIQPIFFRMQRFEFFSEESHHLKNKKLQIVGFGHAP